MNVSGPPGFAYARSTRAGTDHRGIRRKRTGGCSRRGTPFPYHPDFRVGYSFSWWTLITGLLLQMMQENDVELPIPGRGRGHGSDAIRGVIGKTPPAGRSCSARSSSTASGGNPPRAGAPYEQLQRGPGAAGLLHRRRGRLGQGPRLRQGERGLRVQCHDPSLPRLERRGDHREDPAGRGCAGDLQLHGLLHPADRAVPPEYHPHSGVGSSSCPATTGFCRRTSSTRRRWGTPTPPTSAT